MRLLLVTIALLVVVCVFILFFYEIDFAVGEPCYFIILLRRRNSNYGYGIAYKGRFEIWKFGEKTSVGAEYGVFPKMKPN